VSVLALSVAVVAATGSQEIAALFESGAYEEAQQAIDRTGEFARPGEETLWRMQLLDDPDAALTLARDAIAANAMPDAPRVAAALLAARIAYGRARYPETLRTLLPLFDELDAGAIPGAAFVLAGLAYRAVGHPQRAREMFATVRPDDPAFARARYLLGLVALESGDSALALRYFDSAETVGADLRPDLLAGRWRALRSAQETEEAEHVRTQLLEEAPLSLAALTVRSDVSAETEPQVARLEAPEASPRSDAAAASGQRYSVQLAAFQDRSLALAFLARWQPSLPALRIDMGRDERGQTLYRLRDGYFPVRAQAQAAADRLAHSLGLETLVVELTP
jgi:tetratricopeptide (TPR) repeat protein